MRCKACNSELHHIHTRSLPDGSEVLEDLCTKCIQLSNVYYLDKLYDDKFNRKDDYKKTKKELFNDY